MDIPDINEFSNKVKNWQREETRHYLSLPLKSYVLSIIAFFGLCTTFLPWADVTVGFFAQAMAAGLHFFFGWLAFLVFAAIVGVLLFNKYIRLQEPYLTMAPLLGAGIAVLLTSVFILWRMFDVLYGSYLCLVFSIMLLLTVMFYDRIIPGKRKT
jgi:hypothetical protein